jgi:hypothetical protein
MDALDLLVSLEKRSGCRVGGSWLCGWTNTTHAVKLVNVPHVEALRDLIAFFRSAICSVTSNGLSKPRLGNCLMLDGRKQFNRKAKTWRRTGQQSGSAGP